MSSNYWKSKFGAMDDSAFEEVEEAVIETAAGKPVEDPKDGIINIADDADAIEEDYKTWGQPGGLMSGFNNLDKKIGGFGAGHVILVGGETSNGKSAFAANVAVSIARRGDRVLYISLEMTAQEIKKRFRHINNERVDMLNLQIQEEHNVEYNHVRSIIMRAVNYDPDDPLKLVVLDYMQYLGRGMSNQEVAKMSKMFKQLALEFSIPFMVIVSLRKAEGGKMKRKWTDIEIEDFMGTGAIGYDCDTALIVSRKNLEDEFNEDRIFMKLLKTRNARLDYNARFMSFAWHETRMEEDILTGAEPVDEDGFAEV